MVKKLLGAAAMAAVALAMVPAQAAKMGMGCNGANLGKTESAIETMADGDGKWAAVKEMAAAQDSMLNNKWGACSAHLSKAMQDTMVR
jgi:hypothetical protein